MIKKTHVKTKSTCGLTSSPA